MAYEDFTIFSKKEKNNFRNVNVPFPKISFLKDLTPTVIVGDAHHELKAYVGTEKGVWRWDPIGSGGMFHWKDYNDGFPLTTVVDLLIDPNGNLLAATKGRGAWRVIIEP